MRSVAFSHTCVSAARRIDDIMKICPRSSFEARSPETRVRLCEDRIFELRFLREAEGEGRSCPQLDTDRLTDNISGSDLNREESSSTSIHRNLDSKRYLDIEASSNRCRGQERAICSILSHLSKLSHLHFWSRISCNACTCPQLQHEEFIPSSEKCPSDKTRAGVAEGRDTISGEYEKQANQPQACRVARLI